MLLFCLYISDEGLILSKNENLNLTFCSNNSIKSFLDIYPSIGFVLKKLKFQYPCFSSLYFILWIMLCSKRNVNLSSIFANFDKLLKYDFVSSLSVFPRIKKDNKIFFKFLFVNAT